MIFLTSPVGDPSSQSVIATSDCQQLLESTTPALPGLAFPYADVARTRE